MCFIYYCLEYKSKVVVLVERVDLWKTLGFDCRFWQYGRKRICTTCGFPVESGGLLNRLTNEKSGLEDTQDRIHRVIHTL